MRATTQGLLVAHCPRNRSGDRVTCSTAFPFVRPRVEAQATRHEPSCLCRRVRRSCACVRMGVASGASRRPTFTLTMSTARWAHGLPRTRTRTRPMQKNSKRTRKSVTAKNNKRTKKGPDQQASHPQLTQALLATTCCDPTQDHDTWLWTLKTTAARCRRGRRRPACRLHCLRPLFCLPRSTRRKIQPRRRIHRLTFLLHPPAHQQARVVSQRRGHRPHRSRHEVLRLPRRISTRPFHGP